MLFMVHLCTRKLNTQHTRTPSAHASLLGVFTSYTGTAGRVSEASAPLPRPPSSFPPSSDDDTAGAAATMYACGASTAGLSCSDTTRVRDTGTGRAAERLSAVEPNNNNTHMAARTPQRCVMEMNSMHGDPPRTMAAPRRQQQQQQQRRAAHARGLTRVSMAAAMCLRPHTLSASGDDPHRDSYWR